MLTRPRPRGVLLAGLITLGASLVLSAPALAQSSAAGPFQDCPVGLATFNTCFNTTTTTGSFTINDTTVPITAPTVYQGGWLLQGGTATVLGAADGDTVDATPLEVPGGLTGIATPTGLGLLGYVIGDVNDVTATIQLAGPDSPGQATNATFNLAALHSGVGTGATLPVKIKLSNPLLGGSCYVGSDSDPIELNLTTGTTSPPAPNQPITGSPGTADYAGSAQVGDKTIGALVETEASLVDNSFAVPGATGCGPIGLLAPLVDAAIDLKLGLPSPAGNNTAILGSSLTSAGATVVANAESNQ
jgi:hypothetical protein